MNRLVLRVAETTLRISTRLALVVSGLFVVAAVYSSLYLVNVAGERHVVGAFGGIGWVVQGPSARGRVLSFHNRYWEHVPRARVVQAMSMREFRHFYPIWRAEWRRDEGATNDSVAGAFVPLWMPATLFGVIAACLFGAVRFVRSRGRHKFPQKSAPASEAHDVGVDSHVKCVVCGYDLYGLGNAATCPACGEPVSTSVSPVTRKSALLLALPGIMMFVPLLAVHDGLGAFPAIQLTALLMVVLLGSAAIIALIGVLRRYRTQPAARLSLVTVVVGIGLGTMYACSADRTLIGLVTSSPLFR